MKSCLTRCIRVFKVEPPNQTKETKMKFEMRNGVKCVNTAYLTKLINHHRPEYADQVSHYSVRGRVQTNIPSSEKYKGVYRASTGFSQECFWLPFKQACQLVASYDFNLQETLAKAWPADIATTSVVVSVNKEVGEQEFLSSNVPTMSSLEIVKYINDSREVGKAELRHESFMVKVKKVLKGGEQKFLSSYKSLQNKDLPMYVFPKREATLMVMSESYEVQAKVYDRMEELEKRIQVPSFSKAEALKIAYETEVKLVESNMQLAVEKMLTLSLTHEIMEAAPKISFHDAVVADTSYYMINDAAKILGMKPHAFYQWLRDRKYTRKNNAPYAKSSKYLAFKYCEWYNVAGHAVVPTTYVTSAGLAHFQGKLQKEKEQSSGHTK